MLTAIDCIREEIRKLNEAANKCIDEYGVLKSEHKYRYQMIVQALEECRRGLKWLEESF